MRKFLQGFICQIKHKEWKVFPLHVVEMYIANTFRVNPIINPCTRLDYKLFLLALHILYLKNVLNKWEIMWWVAATTSFIAIKYNTYKALIRKTYIVVWNSCVATRSQDHDNISKYHCQEFNIPFEYLFTKYYTNNIQIFEYWRYSNNVQGKYIANIT